MKIERVTNITEWINAINPGEVKSAYLPCDKVQSLNCLASRHNQGRGKQRGKFVHYHYCSDLEVATIICETREDYLGAPDKPCGVLCRCNPKTMLPNDT